MKLYRSVDWYDRAYHDDALQWHIREGHDIRDQDPIFGATPEVPIVPLADESAFVYGSPMLRQVFRVPNHAEHFPIKPKLGWYPVP